MCMDVLPACMSLLHVCLGITCASGVHLDCGYRWLGDTMWVLGTELYPLEGQFVSHISYPKFVHSCIHLINIYECLLYAKHWSQALESQE